MKSILSFYLIGVLYILYACRGRGEGAAQAQSLQQPWRTFQNMTFDMANRGAYNISFCLEEMINCWETVKPELICSWWKYYASVCSLMKDYCAEFYGDTDNYWHSFYLVEGLCEPYMNFT